MLSHGQSWVPLSQRERLSLGHIMAIGAGGLAPSLLWVVVFTLFNPLCTSLQISQGVKTLLLLWGSVAGFIIGPLAGAWSDSSMCRWGRRRPFLVGGGILMIVSMVMMSSCEKISESLETKQFVFIFAVCLAFVAGNSVQGPARTLCSDVVPQHQQVLMSSIVVVYHSVGGIIANLCGGLELYKYTSLGQEQFILIVGIVITVTTLTITIITATEEPLSEIPLAKNAFKQLWHALRRMPKTVTRATVCHFFWHFSAYQFSVQFPHFMAKEIFGGDNASIDSSLKDQYQRGLSWSMVCNVIGSLSQLCYSFVNPKVCEIFTMRWVFVGGMILLATTFTSFSIFSDKYVFLLMSLPRGIGWSCCSSIPDALVSLAIPTEELGGNIGLMVCAAVLGQQASNLGIGRIIGAACNYSPRFLIFASIIPALCGVVAGTQIIQPSPDAYSEYRTLLNDNA